MSTGTCSQISSSLLNSLDASEQVQLSEILDEYMQRLARGEAPVQQSLIEQYPQLSEPLRVYLARLEELQDFLVRPAATLDLSGQTLDDFQLIRPIGRGGMGVVYQAWQRSLQRHVAVKLLPGASFNSSKLEERFEIESRAAAMLEHPHIVPVYATGRADGIRYYAMRLVDGQSLDEVILDEQDSSNDSSGLNIGASELKGILTQFANLADALHAAHEVGIIHRDIKPSNIMQDPTGKLWVTDFGLARIANASAITRTGEMIGTMRYMSPEQALGKGEIVDHRSDIYSLAATLYERITLKPLIEGDEGSELLLRIAKATPPKLRMPPHKCSRNLEIVLQRAMAKHKDDRYTCAAAFRDDLRRIVDGVPVMTARPSSIVRSIRWCVVHPSIVAASLVLMLTWSCAQLVNNWRYQSQFERAQANLESGRVAVNEFGAKLIDDVAMLPGAEDIRRKVVERTLRFAQTFAEQSRDDLQTQADLAKAYTRMGNFLEEQGKLADAIENYQLAENVYATVLQKVHENSSTKEVVQQRLDNTNHLAMATGLLNHSDNSNLNAIGMMADAVVVAEELFQRFPDISVAIELALSRNNYGTLLLQAKRNDQALKELNAALELLDTLSPNEESLESLGESRNRVLATVHHNIGQLLAQSDPDSAVPHFEKAIELRLELAKVKNNRFRTAPELVASYVELGNLFLKHDQNAKAAESFRNANDVSERLLTILPKQQQVMRTNAIAQTNLGIALYRINRRTDGVKSLEAGIASLKELIELNRDRTSLQIDLALAMNNLARMLVDMGQHSEAMATYERAESLLAAQQNFPAKVQLQMIYQSHLESANRMGNTTKADQLKSLLRQANESHQVPFDAGASL